MAAPAWHTPRGGADFALPLYFSDRPTPIPTLPGNQFVRQFEDSEGQVWEVVAGRESWGSIVAIFIPRDEGLPMKQAPAQGSGYEEATAWMEKLPVDELRRLLAAATEKSI